MPDIFDRLLEKRKETDIFDVLKQSSEFERIKKEYNFNLEKKREKDSHLANQTLKTELSNLVKEESQSSKNQLSEELARIIKQEISKIKPVNQIVERIIQQPIKSDPIILPPKIIEKTIKIESKADLSKYDALIEDLKNRIEILKKQVNEKTSDIRVVGDMLPNYQGQDGKVLGVQARSLAWVAQTGNGTVSPEIYSMSNVTIRRTLDANDTSLDELADLIGTLIQDFQTVGLLQ